MLLIASVLVHLLFKSEQFILVQSLSGGHEMELYSLQPAVYMAYCSFRTLITIISI